MSPSRSAGARRAQREVDDHGPMETASPSRPTGIVAFVLTDLEGSTALGDALDSEVVRELLARYFEEMRSVLDAHGGTVEKYIGDAIMAVFGFPAIHEDDALRAVRAAVGPSMALLVRVSGREFGEEGALTLAESTAAARMFASTDRIVGSIVAIWPFAAASASRSTSRTCVCPPTVTL